MSEEKIKIVFTGIHFLYMCVHTDITDEEILDFVNKGRPYRHWKYIKKSTVRVKCDMDDTNNREHVRVLREEQS